MPLLSEAQIRAMMPLACSHLTPHLPYIAPALAAGGIDTPRRIAAWMAEAAHESGEYKYMEEIASGDAYDQRTDLGNTPELDGDGRLFKGRCPFQITGAGAYYRCGVALGLDLIKNPTLITLLQYATKAAVWFWNDKVGGLSPLADRDWIITISRFINGGYNGLQDRLAYWKRNRQILGLPPIDALEWEEADIKAFQAARGLFPDGKVGQKALTALRSQAA
jgi:putative chitinase